MIIVTTHVLPKRLSDSKGCAPKKIEQYVAGYYVRSKGMAGIVVHYQFGTVKLQGWFRMRRRFLFLNVYPKNVVS